MKNILFEHDRKEIYRRICSLTENSPALWGVMSPGQALCHMADQLRVASGEITTAPVQNLFTRTVLKYLVLAGMPAPKGKVKTMAEIDQKIAGTRPTGFDNDRAVLLEKIEQFAAAEDMQAEAHPIFGMLSRRQWGRLVWMHLDHHLRQFGV